MYRYEEYDFYDLRENPALDPEDPEVLYALAQCCFQGKGVERDADAARSFLEKAARRGSQRAQKELSARQEPAASGPETGYDALRVGELSRRADGGDLRAAMRMHRHCLKLEDREEAERYLERCIDAVVSSDQQKTELRREILEEAAAYYRESDAKKSRLYYELAKDLGSAAACRYLLEYYEKGIGGEASPELVEDCVRVLGSQGTPEDAYRCGQWYLERNRRSKAYIVLEDLAESGEPSVWSALAGLRLYGMDPDAVSLQDCLPRLWASAEKPEVQKELTEFYRENKTESVTEAQAMEMAERCQSRQDGDGFAFWLQQAAGAGNAEAAARLEQFRREEARREAEARAREEQEAAERARREAEAKEQARLAEEARVRGEEEARERARLEEEARRKQLAAELEALRQKAGQGSVDAILEFERRAGKERAEEAKRLLHEGVKKRSAPCCLRLAELAIAEGDLTLAGKLCEKAERYDPDCSRLAEEIQAECIGPRASGKAERRPGRRVSASAYIRSSCKGDGIQTLACVIGACLLYAAQRNAAILADAGGWLLCAFVLLFVIPAGCALRLIFRFFKAPGYFDGQERQTVRLRMLGALLLQILRMAVIFWILSFILSLLGLETGAGVAEMGLSKSCAVALWGAAGILCTGMPLVLLFSFFWHRVLSLFWKDNPGTWFFRFCTGA